jgi:nicotinamide-nucleotide amidase
MKSLILSFQIFIMITKAEIIAIGDEILIGQIVNSNASWIAWELNSIGIDVVRMTAVGDSTDAIISAMEESGSRADLILITGGLGPTRDDITKKALCAFFHEGLRLDEPTLNEIKQMLGLRGIPLKEVLLEQALVPDSALAIRNSIGTAPGLWFDKKGKVWVVMPGVPFEMKEMMSARILPELRNRFTGSVILHKTILTQGMGESRLSELIEDWELALPSFIRLAYLPQPGIVRLRLSARGENERMLQQELDEQIHSLQQRIPDLIFGYDDDKLEAITGQILAQYNLTISMAESCTGGYIAHLITTIPGSSKYFKGAVVAYANEVKISKLGVSERSLIEYGAVSEQVVCEMADGARKLMQTDYAIATSGIAGPDGGTPEKPVGTVWIAVSSAKGTTAHKFLFNDERTRNIHRTAITALNMLRKVLIEREK